MNGTRGLEVVLAAVKLLEIVPLVICSSYSTAASAYPAGSSYVLGVIGLEAVLGSLSVQVKLYPADLCSALSAQQRQHTNVYLLHLALEGN